MINWIDDHRDRAQRGDADHRENRIALVVFAFRQNRGDRQRRGSAADRHGARGQNSERPAQADDARAEHAEQNGEP